METAGKRFCVPPLEIERGKADYNYERCNIYHRRGMWTSTMNLYNFTGRALKQSISEIENIQYEPKTNTVVFPKIVVRNWI